MFGRHGRPGGRMFGKGDLKYVFLDLLAEQPRHGYDLIRALEDRFAGTYTASPGTVYPILQMLEDMGYVSVAEQDGRKVYTVTASGHAFLGERRETIRTIWDRAQCFTGRDDRRIWRDMMHDLKDLGVLVARQAHHGGLSSDQMARLQKVLATAKREIEAILLEG